MRLTKTSIYNSLSLLILLCALGACQGVGGDEITAHDRLERSREQLRAKLCSGSGQWALTYFSRCDSLLFTNIDARIGHGDYRERYGYGGHYMTLAFDEQGVAMRGDWDLSTIKAPLHAPYRIDLRSSLSLSFTLYTYIHRLVNNRFSGSADLLYQGADSKGALIFTTSRYTNPGHEYIRLEPLDPGVNVEDVITKSYEHRRLFEKMRNPQLLVREGERIHYHSKYYLKSPATTNQPLLEEITDKRYYLFLQANTEDRFTIERDNYRGFSALGSGYVGTREGLSFRPGFYVNATLKVHDFEFRGDRFVAELVEVYNPILRTTSIESRHLFPEGQVTGFTAEIYDAPIPTYR